MTNSDKYWKAAIIGLVVFNLIAFLGKCDRDSVIPKKETTAEKQLNRTIQADTSAHAKYRALDAQRLAEIRALKRELAASKSQGKQQTEKARQSAQEFAKTPTIDNCKTALTDCQGENETKAYSLAVQEKQLGAYEIKAVADSLEITRNRGVVDSLKTGWGEANKLTAKQDQKIQRKNKLLKIGSGVIAVLVAIVAVR